MNNEMEEIDNEDHRVVEMKLFHGLEFQFDEGKMEMQVTAEWKLSLAWNVSQRN